MPLEIKILDYGDIELEVSFFVLGRDCGRTRRVLTLGFLILGGPIRSSSTPATDRTRSWRRSACAGCSTTRT